MHHLITLLADAAGANDSEWFHVVQGIFMVMVGVIGALIKIGITDMKNAIVGLSARLDRNCRRLRRVEIDSARQVGRTVRRTVDDVCEDETDYEDQ